MARRRRARAGGILDRPVRLLGAVATGLVVGWLWLVANFRLHEMIVGAVVVALSTAFCALVLRSSKLPLDFELRDFLQIGRVPAAIVKDCGILVAVLFADLFAGRPAGSFYRVCGFRSSRHNPLLVGRSALAIVYTTMSPNMIVIGIDPAQSHMLFHQLRRDELSTMTRNLGAER